MGRAISVVFNNYISNIMNYAYIKELSILCDVGGWQEYEYCCGCDENGKYCA